MPLFYTLPSLLVEVIYISTWLRLKKYDIHVLTVTGCSTMDLCIVICTTEKACRHSIKLFRQCTHACRMVDQVKTQQCSLTTYGYSSQQYNGVNTKLIIWMHYLLSAGATGSKIALRFRICLFVCLITSAIYYIIQ